MILNESSRDKLLMPYVELLNNNGIECDLSQVKQSLLAKFVNEALIRNLSLESNFYLAGIAKYYFQGELTTNKELNILNPRVKDKFIPEICERLNTLILILREKYIDSIGTKFDIEEDFGELSVKKLLRKYNKLITKELSGDEEKNVAADDGIDRNTRVGNGYTFDILYSFEDAKKYNHYTEPGAWCITYGKQHYDGYVNRLGIHYVIFLKDGYENVKREKGPGWSYRKPQDEYGNSMIALLQSNRTGEPVFITSRWNHGSYLDNSSCEADHAYTKEEFEKVTGVSDADLQRIFEIWKADAKNKSGVDRSELNKEKTFVLRKFKYAQMRMNGGNFDNAFDERHSIRSVLTSRKKYENLKQTIENVETGNEEELASLNKQLKKLLRNSVTVNTVVINGKSYSFLVDGTKILFDTIRETQRYLYFTTDARDDDYDNARLWGKKDLIMIRKPKANNRHSDDYLMLYNTRAHSYVEVDGVKRFKDIGYRGREARDGYYEVCVSTLQRALIDSNTNMPVRLPNGSCWYEAISSNLTRYTRLSHTISPSFLFKDEGIAKIVYDSSSGEEYLFDLKTKKAISTKELFGKNVKSVWPEIQSLKFDGLSIVRINMKNEEKEYCSLIKDFKPLNIGGYEKFNSIIYGGCGIFFFKLTEDYSSGIIYDYGTKEIVKPPVDDAVYPTAYAYDYDDFNRDMRFTQFQCVNKRNTYILYDLKFKCFLKNPLTNNYYFNAIMFYNISGEITYYSYDSNYTSRRANKYVVDPNAPKVNVVKHEIDDVYEIKMRDINLMVENVLKRIFSK